MDRALQEDTNLPNLLTNFESTIGVLEADLEKALALQNGRALSLDDQIKLDTYLTYLNSTLFWINLKLQGVDTTKHAVVHDLGRAKEMLARDKEINAALAAPRLDVRAAKRFIAAGVGMHTRFVDMDGVMVTEDQYKRSLAESGK
ncbi:hypothetical protein KR038_007381, partial [Drosophila bunnanda]